MTEPHTPATIGGHKINIKVIAAIGGVALLLILLRSRSSAAAASNANTANAGSATSTNPSGTMGDAYLAMFSQLQSDNTAAISQQLSDLQKANQAAIAAQIAKDKTANAAELAKIAAALKRIPPATVHNPVTRKPGGGSGVHSPAGHYVTVQHGDTLSGIAQRAHVSNWHLLLNPRTDAKIDAHPETIIPGQRVWVPA